MLTSLSAIWGAINSLQVIIYMPLFNVRFPANASYLNASLVMIGTFEVLPADYMNEKLFTLPITEPYNVNF